MKTIEDAVIQFGGVWPEFSWEESKQNKHAIVKTIKQWEDAEEGKIYHKGHIGKGGTSVDPEFCEVVCTKPGFESCAKRLGYINGYRWGVEYPTNGERPDLDDDVLIEYKNTFHGDNWVAKARAGNLVYQNNGGAYPVTSFKITGQRYKPADTSYLNASTKTQSLTHSEWWDYENHCIIDEQCPPIGSIVDLRESTEFLSLASGEITIISAGAHCHVVGHAERPDNNFKCVTLMPVINLEAGFCTGNPTRLVRPLDHATRKAELERKELIQRAKDALPDDAPMIGNWNTIIWVIERLVDTGVIRK